MSLSCTFTVPLHEARSSVDRPLWTDTTSLEWVYIGQIRFPCKFDLDCPMWTVIRTVKSTKHEDVILGGNVDEIVGPKWTEW